MNHLFASIIGILQVFLSFFGVVRQPAELSQSSHYQTLQIATHTISAVAPEQASATKSNDVNWIPLSDDSSGYYVERGGKLFFAFFSDYPFLLDGADLPTFKVLRFTNNNVKFYAKDRSHVYDAGRVIEGADPESFEVVLGPSGRFVGFSKDKFHVYSDAVGMRSDVGTVAIPDADPETFTVLTNTGYYSKDKMHVYANWHILPGADSATFVVLKPNAYARDKNMVYFQDSSFPAADPASFQIVDPPQECGSDCLISAKDKRARYAGDIVIP